MGESVCPYCGFVANNIQEEVTHMSSIHRAIILERLRNAGMYKEADDFQRESPK